MLALSTVLILTACSDVGNGPLSSGDWEDMLSAPNFENYTLHSVATITGVDEDTTVKFTKDKVYISGTIGEHPYEVTYTGQEAIGQKKSHEDVFLAVLADFDNFTYDEAAKVYKNPSPVTVSTGLTIEDETITMDITMTNGVVSLTEDGKLLKFECDYAQITHTHQGDVPMTTHMYMEFSDYGTTVIE